MARPTRSSPPGSHGGWASEGGAASYLMPMLNHAAMVANAIHDNKTVPTDYLVHAFNHIGGDCQS